MNIKAFFEMPLPEGSEPFMMLIAKSHGFNPSGELTLNEFLTKEVCEKQISSLFRAIIRNALEGQLGISGTEQINNILAAYDASHKSSAIIADE